MTKYKKIAIFATIYVVSLLGIYQISNYYFAQQFEVLYSLDQKENDQAIINVINQADKYVYFAIYTFTKDNIADALIQAKGRGLTVEGITDLGQSQQDFQKPTIDKLRGAGVPVTTQKHPDGIMHIKAVVTDKAYASGSFNWTQSATVTNDEILEISTNRQLRDQYLKIIQQVLADNAGPEPTKAPVVETISETTEKENKTYDYTQANSHIGETAAISGRVLRVYTSSSNTTFFDYCENYKSCPFSAVIFASDKSKFANLSQYQGQDITIKGQIKSYQGHAEIILNNPDQIIKKDTITP